MLHSFANKSSAKKSTKNIQIYKIYVEISAHEILNFFVLSPRKVKQTNKKQLIYHHEVIDIENSFSLDS